MCKNVPLKNETRQKTESLVRLVHRLAVASIFAKPTLKMYAQHTTLPLRLRLRLLLPLFRIKYACARACTNNLNYLNLFYL